MNERIRELAEQAEWRFADKATGEFSEYDRRLEKFAELIVLECIELRKEMPLKGLPSEEYEEGFWEGLRQYESMIAKHFGIEK